MAKKIDGMDTMDLMEDPEEVSLDAKENPPEEPAKSMSVHTMAQMLGLHKTGSYWLVNKGYFRTTRINGKTRIDIESFEYWYAGQIKYKKPEGPPPGERLRAESYDVHDISRMLELAESTVYELMERDKVPYITVDYWRRWPKEAFDRWYEGQDKYRNRADKTKHEMEFAEDIARSMTMPEAAWLLGISRGTVYSFLSEERANPPECIIVDGRKRILKESFLQWYKKQKKYHMRFETIEEAQADRVQRQKEKPQTEPEVIEEAPVQTESRLIYPSRVSRNPEYYTADEAAQILGRTPDYVKRKIKAGLMPGKRVARSYRVSIAEFEAWMKIYQPEEETGTMGKEGEDNGSDR